jgi:hypothetical protein
MYRLMIPLKWLCYLISYFFYGIGEILSLFENVFDDLEYFFYKRIDIAKAKRDGRRIAYLKSE